MGSAQVAFIGVKLVLHWAHGMWTGVPEIPTLLSLVVIIVTLVVVTLASLAATRQGGDPVPSAHVTEPGRHIDTTGGQVRLS